MFIRPFTKTFNVNIHLSVTLVFASIFSISEATINHTSDHLKILMQFSIFALQCYEYMSVSTGIIFPRTCLVAIGWLTFVNSLIVVGYQDKLSIPCRLFSETRRSYPNLVKGLEDVLLQPKSIANQLYLEKLKFVNLKRVKQH